MILALALLIVHHRLLLGESFFWGLPSLQFVPWRDYALDLLRQGQFPFWNPLNGAGAPLFANYQTALLYPLNWPTFILPLAWSMSAAAVLHLFLAGWGMWTFSERLGLSSLGRGLSALAFGLTGYLVGRLGTYPMIDAAAWLPWLLWAAHGVVSRGRSRDAGWLALFSGLLLLAGHAQTAWYSLLLVGLYAVWLAWKDGRSWQRLAAVAVLLALGAGVAALQLAATADLLRASQRSSGVDFDYAMNFSFAPLRTLNFVAPNLFGTPADGSYREQGAFFEYAVYVGLIPLISAVAALLGWLRRRRAADLPPYTRQLPFWTLIVGVAFVLALGKFSPVFPFLYRYLPTFSLFQAPARWHLWTVFGLSVMAGIGVDFWRRDVRTRAWATRLLLASVAAIIGLVVVLFALPASTEGTRILARGALPTAISAALAAWLTLRQPAPAERRYRRWMALVLIAVALDLGWAAWGLNPTVPAAFYDRRAADRTPTERAYWPDAAENHVKFDTYLQIDDYRAAVDHAAAYRASGLPNLNLLDRLPLLDNFDPLIPDNQAAYVQMIETSDQPAALLQAAGVSSVYLPDGTRRALDRPASRAWVVGGICWHPDADSLTAALRDPDWQPLEQAHALGDGGCPTPAPAEPPDQLLLDDRGSRVQIDLRLRRDGWLVVADTRYPGWTATLDGSPAYVYPVNLAFGAVPVPPGDHLVEFVYRPAWLLPGILISVVSLLITLLLFRLRQTGLPEDRNP